VDNLDKSIKAVKDNDGQITSEKMKIHGVGWFASSLDTEGNKFSLMQATEWQPK
jgi:predicted enzyme related to lactoylglutathione lyase